MTVVPITSADLTAAEVSLVLSFMLRRLPIFRVPDGNLRSSGNIVAQSEQLQNYDPEIFYARHLIKLDKKVFELVAGCAPITEKINMGCRSKMR